MSVRQCGHRHNLLRLDHVAPYSVFLPHLEQNPFPPTPLGTPTCSQQNLLVKRSNIPPQSALYPCFLKLPFNNTYTWHPACSMAWQLQQPQQTFLHKAPVTNKQYVQHSEPSTVGEWPADRKSLLGRQYCICPVEDMHAASCQLQKHTASLASNAVCPVHKTSCVAPTTDILLCIACPTIVQMDAEQS